MSRFPPPLAPVTLSLPHSRQLAAAFWRPIERTPSRGRLSVSSADDSQRVAGAAPARCRPQSTATFTSDFGGGSISAIGDPALSSSARSSKRAMQARPSRLEAKRMAATSRARREGERVGVVRDSPELGPALRPAHPSALANCLAARATSVNCWSVVAVPSTSTGAWSSRRVLVPNNHALAVSQS